VVIGGDNGADDAKARAEEEDSTIDASFLNHFVERNTKLKKGMAEGENKRNEIGLSKLITLSERLFFSLSSSLSLSPLSMAIICSAPCGSGSLFHLSGAATVGIAGAIHSGRAGQRVSFHQMERVLRKSF